MINKTIKQAWYWFYFTRILYVKNRIKSLSVKELILFIILSLIGIYLFCNYTLFYHASLQRTITIPLPATFWICCLCIATQTLFISQKIPLQKNDGILISMTTNNLSVFLLFQLICKSSIFFIPLLISLLYAGIQQSLIAFVFAFVSSFLFFSLITTISYYIKIIKMQSSRKEIIIINLLSIIFISFCVWSVYQDFKYPYHINFIFYSMQLIISSFMGCLVVDADVEILYSFVIQILIGLLFFFLFFRKLKKCTIKLIIDDIKDDEKAKQIVDNDSISPLFYSEHFFIKQILFTFKGVFQLILPSLIYIFLVIYYIYTSISTHEPVDTTAISIVFPIFAIVAFPVIYMTPIWRKEMNYLWIYRLNTATLKKWIFIKVISSYLYCLLSLIIANTLLFLIINCIFHINYFDLMDKISFIFVNIFLPFLTCFFGYFLVARLQDAYYTHNNQLYNILLISFIWIETLLCIPFIILIVIAKKSEALSLAHYIFSCGYIIIANALLYKFTLQKILTKEL